MSMQESIFYPFTNFSKVLLSQKIPIFHLQLGLKGNNFGGFCFEDKMKPIFGASNLLEDVNYFGLTCSASMYSNL